MPSSTRTLLPWLQLSRKLQQREQQSCQAATSKEGQETVFPVMLTVASLPSPPSSHLGDVGGLGVDAQRDGAPAGRGERVLLHHQVARHQGKQVAGLGEGVLPRRQRVGERQSVGTSTSRQLTSNR